MKELRGHRYLAGAVMLLLSFCLVRAGVQRIGGSHYDDHEPQVVITHAHPDDPRIIVVFEVDASSSPSNPDRDIYAAYTNNFGMSWNLVGVTMSILDESNPRVAVGLDDTLHLVYQAEDTVANTDTLGYTFASAYTMGWTRLIWAETWSQDCAHPDIAADQVTNTVWIVMEQGEEGSHDIKACRIQEGSYVLIDVSKASGDETYPRAACNTTNVLVLYQKHSGSNIDILGANGKIGASSLTSVAIAQGSQSTDHPELVATQTGFEYAYQSPSSLYYGFSATGSSHSPLEISSISGDASPSISSDGSNADILFRKNSTTLSHVRISGQDPTGELEFDDFSVVTEPGDTFSSISQGPYQLGVLTVGDSALCTWSGTRQGEGLTADIWGAWWSIQNAFAVGEELNQDFDPGLKATPNPTFGDCNISFVASKAGFADVTVYDVSGRPVRKLLSKRVLPAFINLKWDGCDNHGTPLPNGVYLIKLEDACRKEQVKVVLLR